MPPKKAVSDDEEEEEEDWDALYTDEEDGNGQLDSQTPAEIHKRLLKGSLNQPRHTVISLMTLHGLVHQGLIDLTPDYQREVVWNKAKMIGLIQSLFLNYHIPPILWACSSDNDRGEMVRTCIDGKQRCTSIMRFLDGEIPFVSPSTNEKFFWMMPDRNRGQLLPATLRRKFETMTVPAVEYDDLTDTQQRDIFQRVQLGMTLSSSEKLQAIPGPWPSWISDLRTKFVSKDGTLGDKLDWDKTRGRPFANIAVFVMMAHGSGQSSSQLSSFLERTDAPEEHFKNKVEKALSVLIQIGTDYHQEAFETVSSRLSPIEFQFSCLLIYSRMSVFSARRLAESIGQMRRDIRKTHVDIRANIRLYKALHAILEKLPTKRDRGELPAAEEFSGDVVDPREIRAAKRGRREEAADPSYQGSSIPRGSNANPAMTRQSAGTSASISSSTPRQRVPTGPAAASIPPSNPPRPASSTTSRSTPTGPAYNPSSNGQVPRTLKQPPIPTNQSRQGAPPVSQAPNSAPLGPRSGQEKWTQEQVAHFRAMQQHRINEEQAKRAQGQ